MSTRSSTVERLEVGSDLGKVGLTSLVRRDPEVARAIEAAENERGQPGDSSAFTGRYAVVAPVPIPTPTLRQAEFDALQKWEGHVVSVADTEFSATLVDLTQPNIEEEAVLELSEVSEDDLPLVQPGAVFYWSVGYRVDQSGERSRSSVIWFRRLPAWTEADVERAQVRAAQLKVKLKL